MWGLEYALLFGVPGNKLELIYGKSRCAFPFLERAQAEAHFAAWTDTLRRWKGVVEPAVVRQGELGQKVEVNGFALELAPLPIDIRIPFDGAVFSTYCKAFWRRDLWGGQPPGCETGWEDPQRHSDVHLNLWRLFEGICARHGGQHAGRVDVVLSDTSAIAPDHCYFAGTRDECLIADQYFRGVPDLIAEVLSPATRLIDRGPRKNLYRRAGVPELWLLDPEAETTEIHRLDGNEYRLVATHQTGDIFRLARFPSEVVAVDDLFDTQWKRKPQWRFTGPPGPVPEWLVPEEKRFGLEALFLLGHPEKRFEIWGNRAPCVLPCGSSLEARVRYRDFLEDACRWEQLPVPRPTPLGPDAEQAEVGRFALTRHGRQIHLDVAVDARKYREMLEVWANHDAWDWGQVPRSPVAVEAEEADDNEE